MRKKTPGYVYQGRYGQHQHRVVDMAAFNKLAERIVAAEMAKEERARPVPGWFSRSKEQEIEKMQKSNSDEKLEKAAALYADINKAADLIHKQHEGKQGRFDFMTRDAKLSALHRAEMQTKQKLGLLP